jgi:hypothetical protein
MCSLEHVEVHEQIVIKKVCLELDVAKYAANFRGEVDQMRWSVLFEYLIHLLRVSKAQLTFDEYFSDDSLL